MILNRSALYLATLAVVLSSLSCGGGGAPTEPGRPTPTPLPPSTAAPTPTPSANAACGPNLASGPVARFAVAPRAQFSGGEQVPIRVWIQGLWQEAWCLDKDKEHRLDFNSNQRNADGRECCWVKDPEWQIADDKDRIVLGHGALDEHSFNYRVGVDPRGLETSFGVHGELDGVKSKAWQSGPTVGYPEGPLKVVTLSAADIEKNCKCTYFGNGNYNPECVGR
jgi:hypothetical protein